MRDVPFPQKRELAQEQLATAFSLDYLTEVEYEERVARLQEADTFDKVDALVADLPRDLVPRPGRPPAAEQVIEGSGAVVRRRGHWLRSNRLLLRQSGSTVRLRMDELAELPGARLEIELDIQGCTVRIAVPRGTRVVDEISGHGNVVHVSRRLWRHEDSRGPVVVLAGTSSSSVVRVTALRRRR